MKISIWIKEDDVKAAHDLIESSSIGPFLKNKHKDFEFYHREPGLFTTSGVLPIELLINFEAFIKLRHNFELV